MLLKAKCREMDAVAENPCLGQDADTPNAVDLHLHVRIAIGVSKIGKVRPPRCVFGIAFHNYGVFVECVSQSEGGLGLLPRVQIVGLLSAQPVRKRSPHIWIELVSMGFSRK